MTSTATKSSYLDRSRKTLCTNPFLSIKVNVSCFLYSPRGLCPGEEEFSFLQKAALGFLFAKSIWKWMGCSPRQKCRWMRSGLRPKARGGTAMVRCKFNFLLLQLLTPVSETPRAQSKPAREASPRS